MIVRYVFGRGYNGVLGDMSVLAIDVPAREVESWLAPEYAVLFECEGWCVLALAPAEDVPSRAHVVLCTLA